jgi:hypothetical protein
VCTRVDVRIREDNERDARGLWWCGDAGRDRSVGARGHAKQRSEGECDALSPTTQYSVLLVVEAMGKEASQYECEKNGRTKPRDWSIW